MSVFALASDFDETLACRGRVRPQTVAALHRFRKSGRRLVLVTGRELADLRRVFPELELFDRIVAGDGGTLLRPPARATCTTAAR